MFRVPFSFATVLLAVGLGAALAAPSDGDVDFELYDLSDKLERLEDIRSSPGARVVAVDFFQVDCAPCKAALPAWSRAVRELGPKGLRVVVVAVPGPESPSEARRRLEVYFQEHKVPFPVLFDPYSVVAERYDVVQDGATSVPQVFLVSREGRVIGHEKDHERALAGATKRLR